jgi:hypothetical protein
MTDHPITPPPELVQQWLSEFLYEVPTGQSTAYIAARAAQWGADQELEACCEWLKSEGHEYEHEALFAARRPKPPSLKKQALEALDDVSKMSETLYSSYDPPEEIYSDQVDIIRRALEALPDD